MRPIVKRDFMYGVYLGAEGARSGGEANRNGGPPRGNLSARLVTFTIQKFRLKQPGDDFLPNTRIFFDACKGIPGAIGSLLRREGLYSSHLTAWKKQMRKANWLV